MLLPHRQATSLSIAGGLNTAGGTCTAVVASTSGDYQTCLIAPRLAFVTPQADFWGGG